MSKDWLPKYKKLPRWKYLRVDDWDTEWKAPMSDFELGFWTVNGFHTLEDAHQPTADARPPESLLGKIDYDRQIGWQVVESFKQNPYWYSNWNGSDRPKRFDEVLLTSMSPTCRPVPMTTPEAASLILLIGRPTMTRLTNVLFSAISSPYVVTDGVT